MSGINLDSLPPWLAWPIALFIVSIIVFAGKEMLDAINEETDNPDVQASINSSKQALDNYEEGLDKANELREDLSKLPKNQKSVDLLIKEK